MTIITKKRTLLAKVEIQEGVEATPSPSTDAIRVENMNVQLSPDVHSTNTSSNGLDMSKSYVGGRSITISFDVYVKGSGDPTQAPECAPLLRACGFQEAIVSALPASPEACAGGTDSTAILGASASTDYQYYQGMPVEFTGSQAGVSFIADYQADKTATLTSKLAGAVDVGTSYQILPHVGYRPMSENIPSLTFHAYYGSGLYKIVGARGNMSISLTSRQAGKLSFSFQGLLLSFEHSAPPSVSFDTGIEPIWRKDTLSDVPMATMYQQSAPLSGFSIDIGNQITLPDNANQPDGYDPAVITSRNTTGSIAPKASVTNMIELMDKFYNREENILYASIGRAAGNRIGITVPRAYYTGHNFVDQGGVQGIDAPFSAATEIDSAVFLTFF